MTMPHFLASVTVPQMDLVRVTRVPGGGHIILDFLSGLPRFTEESRRISQVGVLMMDVKRRDCPEEAGANLLY